MEYFCSLHFIDFCVFKAKCVLGMKVNSAKNRQAKI